MKTAIFAGTFDPVTLGHESVIEKSAKLFDEVLVAICINPQKQTLFSVEDRLKMLNCVCNKYQNVKITYHEGLLVDLMKSNKIIYNVRGVRNTTDYEYENSMHEYNSKLYPDMVTLYIPCCKKYKDVSSTAVRNIIEGKENLSGYLSKEVENIIKKLDN